MTAFSQVEAVTFDFFNTLVFHRTEGGRGRVLIEYLDAHGFKHAPWEHQVLYEVFQEHDARYSPSGPESAKAEYYTFLADRVFKRLQVTASKEDASRHASALWRILGPSSLEVFPDTWTAVRTLRGGGYPLAVISNWQCGLRHFCFELGLSEHFDHILGSADIGIAKPEPSIFLAACARLGVPPDRVLHIGDSLTDDYLGAKAVGLHGIILNRDGGPELSEARVIHGLDELVRLLGRCVGGHDNSGATYQGARTRR